MEHQVLFLPDAVPGSPAELAALASGASARSSSAPPQLPDPARPSRRGRARAGTVDRPPDAAEWHADSHLPVHGSPFLTALRAVDLPPRSAATPCGPRCTRSTTPSSPGLRSRAGRAGGGPRPRVPSAARPTRPAGSPGLHRGGGPGRCGRPPGDRSTTRSPAAPTSTSASRSPGWIDRLLGPGERPAPDPPVRPGQPARPPCAAPVGARHGRPVGQPGRPSTTRWPTTSPTVGSWQRIVVSERCPRARLGRRRCRPRWPTPPDRRLRARYAKSVEKGAEPFEERALLRKG